jgi:PPM family protein phosphatase
VNLDQVLEVVQKTDPGKMRARNEDAIACIPRLGVTVLADGMGGHNAGEIASGMATTFLVNEFDRLLSDRPLAAMPGDEAPTEARRLLLQLIGEVNLAIFQASESNPQYKGMGTTLVVALFFDNRMMVAHIGDSRLYRYRDGELVQLTRDHSLLQEWIDNGMITPEQALTAQHKNLVTRALGVETKVEPEIHEHEVLPGDLILLCSDGLNDMVLDEDIALTLGGLGANLALAATQLVDQANDNGGKDNVSVVLVKAKAAFTSPQGWWAKFKVWLK